MKKKLPLVKTSIFSILSLLVAIYALFIPRGSEFLMLRALFFYLIFLGIAVLWNLSMLYKSLDNMTSDTVLKYDNLQRLLLDLRDGTKNFFGEKRRAIRIRADMLARFVDKVSGDDFVKINEISASGARLVTTQAFKVGDIVKLNIYLPFFPQPIFVKVRVARTRPTTETKGTSPVLEAGVEYQEMSDGDMDMLLETLDILSKEPRKKK